MVSIPSPILMGCMALILRLMVLKYLTWVLLLFLPLELQVSFLCLTLNKKQFGYVPIHDWEQTSSLEQDQKYQNSSTYLSQEGPWTQRVLIAAVGLAVLRGPHESVACGRPTGIGHVPHVYLQ